MLLWISIHMMSCKICFRVSFTLKITMGDRFLGDIITLFCLRLSPENIFFLHYILIPHKKQNHPPK